MALLIKSDLSVLMELVIDLGIVFMVSQSGIPGNYNLYFAKHTKKGNKSLKLSFEEKTKAIYQYADTENGFKIFTDIDSVLEHVCNEILEGGAK